MKKFYSLLFLLTFSIGLHAQDDISWDIDGTFVEGISPVYNTFYAWEYPGSAKAVFFLINTNNQLIDTYTDDNVGDGYTWELDMGSLPADASELYVLYRDINDGNLDYSNNSYFFYILPTPFWLANGGEVTNVTVNGNFLEIDAKLSILGLVDNSMPNDVPGLTSRPYSLDESNLSFHIDYDYTQLASQSTISDPNLNFALNVFNQVTIPYTYPLDINAQLTLDDNFDLAVIAEGEYNSPEFNVNFPLFRYPVVPLLLTVKVDGGIKLNATLSGKLVFGYDQNYSTWGFIELNGETSRVTAKVNGEGFLRVSTDAILAKVSGSVIARGSIGGGFDYVSVPQSTISPLFGLSLEIAGAVDYKLGKGIFSTEGHYEKTFYSNTWGDQLKMPLERPLFDYADALGNYSKTIQENASFEVQDFFAQPVFSSNTDDLCLVWLDYENDESQLLFSKLDYVNNGFTPPLEVIGNVEGLTSPDIALMPSGSALITWTQNRYTSATFDTTQLDIINLFNAQDIWATIYDNSDDSFLPAFRLSDDITSEESGRAEGNANITMGRGNYGLITWIAADLQNQTSEIYFTEVLETNDTWDFGTPQVIPDLPVGINQNVNVAFFDSLMAIAVWINDPDGTDSTTNNDVVFKIWDGTQWSATSYLTQNDGYTQYDEVSADFFGDYGAVAITSTHYDDNGAFVKSIIASAWDSNNDDWGQLFQDTASDYYFAQPEVSVNEDGLVSMAYQAIELFGDTLNPDEGVLYLLLNDSQTDPDTWEELNNSALLGDGNVYVADLQASFGSSNDFYIMTQEADNETGEAPANPVNGVRFGNDYLNLVLRGFTVDGNLDVEGIEEPDVVVTYTKDIVSDKFQIKNIYPNPFSEQTNIEFVLKENSKVNIEVFDLWGNKVATVLDANLTAGLYTTAFRPSTNLASGVYSCVFTINNDRTSKKLLLTK